MQVIRLHAGVACNPRVTSVNSGLLATPVNSTLELSRFAKQTLQL